MVLGRKTIMSAIRTDSTSTSYVKALSTKKESNGAENLKSGIMSSLMKPNVQVLMTKIASGVFNHCLQPFENALPTVFNNKMATAKVELRVVRSANRLEVLQYRDRFFTYAFFQPDNDVIYSCLRASKIS